MSHFLVQKGFSFLLRWDMGSTIPWINPWKQPSLACSVSFCCVLWIGCEVLFIIKCLRLSKCSFHQKLPEFVVSVGTWPIPDRHGGRFWIDVKFAFIAHWLQFLVRDSLQIVLLIAIFKLPYLFIYFYILISIFVFGFVLVFIFICICTPIFLIIFCI